MSARVRACIQKCIHWSDAALTQSPTQYFLTPEWKKAVQYARDAQTLAQPLAGRPFPWTALELKIIQRGYPVLSAPQLWKEEGDDAPEAPSNTTTSLVDPLVTMQDELNRVTAEHRRTATELQTLQQSFDARHIQLRTELDSVIRTLETQLKTLQDAHSVLLDEHAFQQKLHAKQTKEWRERMQQHIHAETQATKQIVYYQRICEYAVSLLSHEQKQALHAFVDALH